MDPSNNNHVSEARSMNRRVLRSDGHLNDEFGNNPDPVLGRNTERDLENPKGLQTFSSEEESCLEELSRDNMA
jgi:hypothetical protein